MDFRLHWQAPKSMILLARASGIIDFAYMCKLPKEWFCRGMQNLDIPFLCKLPNLRCRVPGQVKSSISLTLASCQIYGFACQGTQNH